jgi:hypothetical protein
LQCFSGASVVTAAAAFFNAAAVLHGLQEGFYQQRNKPSFLLHQVMCGLSSKEFAAIDASCNDSLL